jgi:anti-sigma factor ChrR (cupin superfamily)
MTAERLHPPRPVLHAVRSLDDVATAIGSLAGRIEMVVAAQLEQSHHTGRIIAELANVRGAIVELRASLASQRGQLDSVPEMITEGVTQAIDGQELATWRARRALGVKIVATVIGGLLLLYLGRFLPH